MHRSSDFILAMVETGSTMRFLLNPLLFLPRPESQPLPWLNLLLLLRQNFLSAYCVLIHNLTDADPHPQPSPPILSTYNLGTLSTWLWLWLWPRPWLSLWQRQLMDMPQSSKSQAWQEVASIHSSAILQAPLAPSE